MAKKRIRPKRAVKEEQQPAAQAQRSAEAEVEEAPEVDAQKLEELSAELDEERERSQEIHDKYLRALADLDNFRKRSRAQLEEERRRATREVIVSILSVADNLERAVDSAQKGDDSDALLQGVKLTLKQCHETLAGFGVEPIEALGCEFDPIVHEAVMQVPSSDDDDGKVVGEIQKGYRMGDMVIRPAQVQVGKAAKEAEAASAEG